LTFSGRQELLDELKARPEQARKWITVGGTGPPATLDRAAVIALARTVRGWRQWRLLDERFRYRCRDLIHALHDALEFVATQENFALAPVEGAAE
jgi:hypothetical protein